MSNLSDGAMMSEAPSYTWENKKYLLDIFMKKLNITERDLENNPSWIKSKVRELNIDTLLEN